MSLLAPSRTKLPSPCCPTPYNNNNYKTTYTIRLHPHPISKPNHPHCSLVMQMLLKLVAVKLSHFHPAVAGVRGLAGAPLQRTRAADPAIHSEYPTGDDAEQAARTAAAADKERPWTSTVDDTMLLRPQPVTLYDASPKLDSSELGCHRPPRLNLEQRRSIANPPRVKEASCDVGVDGGSIVEDQKARRTMRTPQGP